MYLTLFWYWVFVHFKLKLLDLLSNFVLILAGYSQTIFPMSLHEPALLTLNKLDI